MKIRLVVLFFFILSTIAEASNKGAHEYFTGTWSGTAKTDLEVTTFILEVYANETGAAASVSLPLMGAARIPAKELVIQNSEVNMVLHSDSGNQPIRLALLNNKLIGSWKDKNDLPPASVELEKTTRVKKAKEFRERVVGQAGNIGASYMIPEGSDFILTKFTPVVIMAHGSGPLLRDTNRFLAESFAKNGIISVFFDKRGTGESDGSYINATLHDLANDAVSVAQHFKRKFGSEAVGFWGHSQGGWVSQIASDRLVDSAFTIMVASPLVSPAQESKWSFLRPIINSHNFSKIEQKVESVVEEWHNGIRKNDFSSYWRLVNQYKASPWYLDAGLTFLEENITDYILTTYKKDMDYEPKIVLSRSNSSFLAIYTLDDESINSLESISIIEGMKSGKSSISLIVYEGLNHNMRKNGNNESILRFPGYPEDYIKKQVEYIASVLGGKL